ncbi:MAG TPA: hypothetical protein VM425_18205 [Myxococcota bacterium]|nr:hypothetical protein [Myxococcota bacterium]
MQWGTFEKHFPPWSAADRLAADPAMARKLGRAGRRQVRRGFDPKCQMDLLLEAYSLFRASSM